MPDPSHPYVARAAVSKDGDQITFRVEVSEYATVGGSVEISGQATQSSGAFASIYAMKPVPSKPNGDAEDTNEYFVDVTVDTVPPNRFRISEDVVVYVKVSRPWITVLGKQTQTDIVEPDKSDVASETTWDRARATTHIDGTTWAQAMQQAQATQ
jgi:hypothetical protein